MALIPPSIPARALGDPGQVPDYNAVRAFLISALKSWADGVDGRLDDIELALDTTVIRGETAAVEPAHDGSQSDGWAWIQPQ